MKGKREGKASLGAGPRSGVAIGLFSRVPQLAMQMKAQFLSLIVIVGLFFAESGLALNPSDCASLRGQLVTRFREAGVSLVGGDRVAELNCTCKDDQCDYPLKVLNEQKITSKQKESLLKTVDCSLGPSRGGQNPSRTVASSATSFDPCVVSNQMIQALFSADGETGAGEATPVFYDSRRGGRGPSRIVRCRIPEFIMGNKTFMTLLMNSEHCPTRCVLLLRGQCV